ncbi:MAG: T9SS type A sorting domain-containing protein [Paludibacter sp.]
MKKTLLSLFFFALVLLLSAQNQAPEATTATAGTLTVTFSTNNTSKYSAAIYITNSAGTLVNTMLYRTSNSHNSAQDMSTFWSKIGLSWSTSPAKLLTNADAVTGATATSAYTAQKIYWGKNVSIATAVDGTYTVNFEMANYSPVSRRYTSGTFVKGPAASTTSLTNITGFSAITIEWMPVSTAVDDVEFSKLYNVYPNPAVSSIYAAGNDVEEIQICTLAGKILLSSKVQQVNISKLAKGFYLAVIYAKDGMVVKKIEKV